MRHDGCVGIASSSDGVTEISVVEDPTSDGQNGPKEDVVQSSRAEFDATAAAVQLTAAAERPVVNRRRVAAAAAVAGGASAGTRPRGIVIAAAAVVAAVGIDRTHRIACSLAAGFGRSGV